jgi:hypothetical protein
MRRFVVLFVTLCLPSLCSLQLGEVQDTVYAQRVLFATSAARLTSSRSRKEGETRGAKISSKDPRLFESQYALSTTTAESGRGAGVFWVF